MNSGPSEIPLLDGLGIKPITATPPGEPRHRRRTAGEANAVTTTAV
jgi:hypothetical protein